MACGETGDGRMAEPEEILAAISHTLQVTDNAGISSTRHTHNAQLHGLKALITAGPTYEPLDPVRFIGNRSFRQTGVTPSPKRYAIAARRLRS